MLRKRAHASWTLAAGIAALLFGTAVGHAAIIADWTFETSQPTTAGPFNPEVGNGSASGFHSSTSVYSSPAGNGSSHSFSSTVWSVGDYYQFSVSTTGQGSISLTFDQTSSNTGPKDFKVQYSTNGTSFTDDTTYSVLANASPNPTWNATTSSSLYTTTVSLTSITALNNQTTIYLRLTDADTVSANGGTVATTGTDRVDNVIISASPVPEPASAALLAGIVAAFACRRNQRAA